MDPSFWLRLLGVCSSNRLPLYHLARLGDLTRSISKAEGAVQTNSGGTRKQASHAARLSLVAAE